MFPLTRSNVALLAIGVVTTLATFNVALTSSAAPVYKVSTFATGSTFGWSTSLAIDNKTGIAWIGNYEDGHGPTVTGVRLSDKKVVASVSVGMGPTLNGGGQDGSDLQSVAVNETTGEVYALSGNNVYQISESSSAVTADISLPGATAYPNHLAIDATSNKIFASANDYQANTGFLTTIDGSTLAQSTTSYPEMIGDITVDPGVQTVWATSDGKALAINENTGVANGVVTSTQETMFSTLAVNSTNHQVIVIQANLDANYNPLYTSEEFLIDGTTQTLTSSLSAAGDYSSVAVDSSTGTLYTVYATPQNTIETVIGPVGHPGTVVNVASVSFVEEDIVGIDTASKEAIIVRQAGAIDAYAVSPTIQSVTMTTPAVTGSPNAGAVLTAHPGLTTPQYAALSYSWFLSGRPIAGATARTFRVLPVDAGKMITVRVTATAAGYQPVTRSSANLTINRLLTGSPTPTIVGTGRVGARESVRVGSWKPAPVKLNYQWKRAGANIAGATGSSYVLTKKDLHKSITVTVMGSKPGFTTVSRTSKTVVPR